MDGSKPLSGRRTYVEVRFGPDRRPVAVSTTRGRSGPRISLEIEREALDLGSVHLLYRGGGSGVIIAGSISRERLQPMLEALRDRRAPYEIVKVPVVSET